MMKHTFKTRMQFILTLRNGDISDQNKDEQGHKNIFFVQLQKEQL